MHKARKTKKNFRTQLNQATFLLVIAMGLISGLTIITDPQRQEDQILMRAPASLPTVEIDSIAPSKITNVISIGCANDTATVLSGQVRLRGHLCQGEGNIVSTQIENLRNGYVATVFHQDDGFTTDFIQLSEGENKVSVKHTLSNGSFEELSYVITRQ